MGEGGLFVFASTTCSSPSGSRPGGHKRGLARLGRLGQPQGPCGAWGPCIVGNAEGTEGAPLAQPPPPRPPAPPAPSTRPWLPTPPATLAPPLQPVQLGEQGVADAATSGGPMQDPGRSRCWADALDGASTPERHLSKGGTIETDVRCEAVFDVREGQIPVFVFGDESMAEVAPAGHESVRPLLCRKTRRGVRRSVCCTAPLAHSPVPATETFSLKESHVPQRSNDARFGEEAAGSSEEPDELEGSDELEGPNELEPVWAEAAAHAREDRHAEALRCCLRALRAGALRVGALPAGMLPVGTSEPLGRLGGPGCLGRLGPLVDGWEAAERRRVLSQEDERRRLAAQLMDAQERLLRLREQRDVRNGELAVERRRRAGAEERALEQAAEAAELRERLLLQQNLLQENARLRQQLRQAQAQQAQAQAQWQAQAQRTPPSRQEVVRQLAELECRPLRACCVLDRVALRKKILLKWHPDKQPSMDHAGLATQVVQEIQNMPEWSM